MPTSTREIVMGAGYVCSHNYVITDKIHLQNSVELSTVPALMISCPQRLIISHYSLKLGSGKFSEELWLIIRVQPSKCVMLCLGVDSVPTAHHGCNLVVLVFNEPPAVRKHTPGPYKGETDNRGL